MCIFCHIGVCVYVRENEKIRLKRLLSFKVEFVLILMVEALATGPKIRNILAMVPVV